MPIGKSRRVVIDVEDVALKRRLYAVLAVEGRSLKDWFESAVSDYLSKHTYQPDEEPLPHAAETPINYKSE